MVTGWVQTNTSTATARTYKVSTPTPGTTASRAAVSADCTSLDRLTYKCISVEFSTGCPPLLAQSWFAPVFGHALMFNVDLNTQTSVLVALSILLCI